MRPGQSPGGVVMLELGLVGAGLALALSPLSSGVIGVLIASGHVVAMVVAPRRRRIVDVGLGLVWAAADMVFVQAGVFAYARPGVLGPPGYMPLLFAQLAVGLGLVLRTVDPLRGRGLGRSDLARLGGAFAAVVALHAHVPGLLTFGLGAAWIACAAAVRFDRRTVLLSVVFGLGEPLLEAALVGLGMFRFADAGWIGLPPWYAPLFALVAVPVTRAFTGGWTSK